MSSAPAAPRVVQVELTEQETIAAGGVVRVGWFVRERASFVHASRVPGAEVCLGDAGPGVVWRRTIRISVPAGTALMRVEGRPRPGPRRDPFDYLRREVRASRRAVTRTYYTVRTDGGLRAERTRSARSTERRR